MEKVLTIATEHSTHKPKQKITLKLEGGSPWFSYIWLNDVCYTVIGGQRTIKINKTNYRR